MPRRATPPACHRDFCDLESVEEFSPYCSRECQKVSRLTTWQGIYVPKNVSGQYQPPPVAPWSWLDARAASEESA